MHWLLWAEDEVMDKCRVALTILYVMGLQTFLNRQGPPYSILVVENDGERIFDVYL